MQNRYLSFQKECLLIISLLDVRICIHMHTCMHFFSSLLFSSLLFSSLLCSALESYLNERANLHNNFYRIYKVNSICFFESTYLPCTYLPLYLPTFHQSGFLLTLAFELSITLGLKKALLIAPPKKIAIFFDLIKIYIFYCKSIKNALKFQSIYFLKHNV